MFNSKNFWLDRYAKKGNSGYGSYGILSTYKAAFINNFIKKKNLNSVIDFGCGDGNQLKLLNIPSYIGFDISSSIIEKCKNIFENDKTKQFKLLYDYNNETADITLSCDVIFHLTEDDVYNTYMTRLFNASKKYVIIYSSNTDVQEVPQPPHMRHRNFHNWIKNNVPEWKLLLHEKNPYPYINAEISDPKNTSLSNFCIYEKKINTATATATAKVLIAISCYNAENTIIETINSLINQSYQNFRIFLYDDASTDRTYPILKEILKAIKTTDNPQKIKLSNTMYNKGVYIALNEILKQELKNDDWDYFFHVGADDTLTPETLKKFVRVLQDDNIKIVGSNYQKGSYKGPSNGYGMVKRECFEKLGYYDNVRFGADTDLLERIVNQYGQKSSYVIDSINIIMNVENYSQHLTKIYGLKKRMNYVNTIQNEIQNGLKYRPYIDNTTTVSIASIPSREHHLEKVIYSIYKQVNYINVYLNEYTHIPSFLNEKKITVYTSQKNGGDRGDNGKFYSIANTGFNLTLDDDIAVMPDYVKRLTDTCNNHRRNCFASFYGSIFKLNDKGNINSFRRDRYTFPIDVKELSEDTQVDYVGTGVMCFHTDAIKNLNFNNKIFLKKNMADIFICIFCKKNKIPRYCIARKKHEFDLLVDTGIFQKSIFLDPYQTKLLNDEYFNTKQNNILNVKRTQAPPQPEQKKIPVFAKKTKHKKFKPI